MDYNKRLHDDIILIEEELKKRIPVSKGRQSIVEEAMRYSVLNGGKRIRGILVLESCLLCGGDLARALPLAAAVEMIHSYSLIHDDLPCMDDDDMRRGKPSCHIAFGEATALLAGDGLLTKAFETIFDTNIEESILVQIGKTLTVAIGTEGMIGGQVIDMLLENTAQDINLIQKMHELKTGALITACCEIGSIAANAEKFQRMALKKYAQKIGLVFQIIDDILDVTGDEKLLGKRVNSDINNKKVTFVSEYGIERSKELAEKLTNDAKMDLSVFEKDHRLLMFLADMLFERNN